VAIPDYQTLMQPVLAVHADGREHSSSDIREALAARFGLTDEDRRRLLPSGRTPLFNNRAHWAVTYLAQALALERTRRGHTRITERGRQLLDCHPERVGTDDLEEFPEFVAFVSRSTGRARRPSSEQRGNGDHDAAAATPSSSATPRDATTPDEVMDAAYRELHSALADELLERIKAQQPAFFEGLVLDVLTAMGYGGSRSDAAERLGRAGDGGIDGVIREDALGLDVIYVQAKRWDGSVGRPVIQGFVGALHGAHAEKGVLITTSHFTSDAIRYAEGVSARVILIDGLRLAELMIDWGVGVTETTRYELKRVDGDYFPEEQIAPPDDASAGVEQAHAPSAPTPPL
jgi:restriction system protein